MTTHKSVVPAGRIEQRILLIRGEKVIIDADLASFYGTTTKRLNEQVKRNRKRFPADFMFQLSEDEKSEVVAHCDHLANLKYSRTLPHAFTEHGALMAASVLNTSKAVEVSVYVIRAFVRLRHILSEHKEIAQKVASLERGLAAHDTQIVEIIKAIKYLMSPSPVPKKRRIGFLEKKSSSGQKKTKG